MRHRLFVLFALFCATGMAFAQAYRWVDENGVVHFSDRPQPGAEEIVLPESRTPARPVLPRQPAVSPVADEPAEPEPEDEGYQSLEITSPGAEQVLWNIAGTLDVSLDLQPALRPAHQVRVYFDGEPRIVNGTSFQIGEVFRGTHNIQVEVVDATGQLMIRSQTHRFYVQQTSILNPSRAGPGPR